MRGPIALVSLERFSAEGLTWAIMIGIVLRPNLTQRLKRSSSTVANHMPIKEAKALVH